MSKKDIQLLVDIISIILHSIFILATLGLVMVGIITITLAWAIASIFNPEIFPIAKFMIWLMGKCIAIVWVGWLFNRILKVKAR